MNREIKFRVWLDYNNSFEYPKLITFHGDGVVETDRSRGGIVQQFTGLLDKNGKEIYEGDIVRYDSDPYLVKNGLYTTGDENFNGDFLFIENAAKGLDYGISLFNVIKKVTIIGNIFQTLKSLKS